MVYSLVKDMWMIYFDHRVNVGITVTAKGMTPITHTTTDAQDTHIYAHAHFLSTSCTNITLNISGWNTKTVRHVAQKQKTHTHTQTYERTHTRTPARVHTHIQ